MMIKTNHMRLIAVLVILLIGISNSNAMDTGKCTNIFKQTDLLTEQAGKEKNESRQLDYLYKITDSIISSTEYYLNNCSDSKLPLSKQVPVLQRLEKEGKKRCSENRTKTQLIDVNNDGRTELLVHTRLLACEDFSGHYDAGFAALFFLNRGTGLWKGHAIWPVQLLERHHPKMTAYDFAITQYHPRIYVLPFKDKKKRTFMAIESQFIGADNEANLLSIIRTENQQLKTILNLNLTDWCGQPNNWTITRKGTVIVPAAKVTSRCDERKRKVYNLEQP